MESLSIGISSSPAFQNHPRTHKPASKSTSLLQNSSSASRSCDFDQSQILFPKKTTPPIETQSVIHRLNATRTTHYSNLLKFNFPAFNPNSFFNSYLKSQLSFLSAGFSIPLSCFASETAVPTEELSNKINLEAIVVSIDDFFNRYPFFVAGVTFIWLVVIPLTEEFFQKYKFVSAINAFRKLRDDPISQLLDIRDKKTLQYFGSPNLKLLNKSAVQVDFSEGDEEGFVKKVLEKFSEPANTVIVVLDNFDGNSMKVAELLFKNGFKEAYAIRGGVRGKNGWQAIQETLLPPSVHIYPKKKVKIFQQPEMNGGVNKQSDNYTTSSPTLFAGQCEKDPNMKPPSSPTPSKP
ncbi:hypothetical protein U1Q18_013241 [Sarracenia purpurea var. burkii]